MPAPRFGATVVPLGGQTAFVFGGNEADPQSMAGLVLGDGTFVTLQFNPATPPPPAIPYLAAGAYVSLSGGRHAVILAGGHDWAGGPGVQSAKRLALALIDDGGVAPQIEWKMLDVGPQIALFERSAGQIVKLADGDFVMLGGFTALRTYDTGAEQCEGQTGFCLRQTVVRFRVDAATETATVIDDSVQLSVGALGAWATPLGDGSMLVTSGLASITNTSIPVESELLRFPGPLDALCAAQPSP
jgi:hypothetical protein